MIWSISQSELTGPCFFSHCLIFKVRLQASSFEDHTTFSVVGEFYSNRTRCNCQVVFSLFLRFFSKSQLCNLPRGETLLIILMSIWFVKHFFHFFSTFSDKFRPYLTYFDIIRPYFSTDFLNLLSNFVNIWCNSSLG